MSNDFKINFFNLLCNNSYFTDYQLQKVSGNVLAASKSFSYIVLCFDNPEILEEIKVLVHALKMADKNEKISDEAEFYVNMFKYFADGPAGQKIIMLLTSDSDTSDFTYIRIMKKFSKNFNLSIHAVSSSSLKIEYNFKPSSISASFTWKDSSRHQRLAFRIDWAACERSFAFDDDRD